MKFKRNCNSTPKPTKQPPGWTTNVNNEGGYIGPNSSQDPYRPNTVNPLDQAILSQFNGQIAAGGNDAFNDNFFKNFIEQFVDIATGQTGAYAANGQDNALDLIWSRGTFGQQRGQNSNALEPGLLGEDHANLADRLVPLQGGQKRVFAQDPGDATQGAAAADGAQQVFRPIALDLDGDGQIGKTSKADGKGVLFDVDGDGFAEQTDWIGTKDGFLAIDRDGDGEINDSRNDSSEVNGYLDRWPKTVKKCRLSRLERRGLRTAQAARGSATAAQAMRRTTKTTDLKPNGPSVQVSIGFVATKTGLDTGAIV